MYFKVDRKVLKKALVWLKKQPVEIKVETDSFGRTIKEDSVIDFTNYIEQIEFALYKTKMEEFYIDFEFAQTIRPALLTKKVTKHD